MPVKKELPNFTLRLPTLSTRKVWVGCYSEMTGTVVMLFNRKPKKCPVLKHYNVLDPNYIGSVWIDEWEHWFGTVQPLVDASLIEDRGPQIGWVVVDEDLDCHKVIQVEVTMLWNEHGQPVGLNVSADN